MDELFALRTEFKKGSLKETEYNDQRLSIIDKATGTSDTRVVTKKKRRGSDISRKTVPNLKALDPELVASEAPSRVRATSENRRSDKSFIQDTDGTVFVISQSRKTGSSNSITNKAGQEGEFIKVEFKTNNGIIRIASSTELNAHEVKLQVLAAAKSAGENNLKNAQEYAISVPVIGYNITTENLQLRRIPFVQLCNISYIHPRFEMILLDDENSIMSSDLDLNFKAHIDLELEIFELIGSSLSQAITSGYEATCFRKDFAKFCETIEIRKQQKTEQYTFVLSEPLPLNIPPKLTILCQLPNEEKMVKRLECRSDADIQELKELCFKKFQMIDKKNSEGKVADNFILKVTGFREYLLSKTMGETRKVMDYDIIRKLTLHSENITLSLSDKKKTLEGLSDASDLTSITATILIQNSNNNIYHSRSNTNSNLNLYQNLDQEIESIYLNQINSPFRIKLESISGIDFKNIYTKTLKRVELALKKKKDKGYLIEKPSYSKKELKSLIKELKIDHQDNLENIQDIEKNGWIYVCAELYHGGEKLCSSVFSPIILYHRGSSNYGAWDKWLDFPFVSKNLPKAARICFTVYITNGKKLGDKITEILPKDIAVGWVNCQLINHKSTLRSGSQNFKLWEDAVANPIGTIVQNLNSKSPPILGVHFENYNKSVFFPQKIDLPVDEEKSKMDANDAKLLLEGLKKGPLQELTTEEKTLIWKQRLSCKNKPGALAKFLKSVDWSNPSQVGEAHKLIWEWATLTPLQSLELLDAHFADAQVRKYCVQRLNELADHELAGYLLQLTQVIKYEPYHNSELVQFLITRALNNRNQIGHALFWFLKGEMHLPEINERYALILESYLRKCGEHRSELKTSHQILQDLTRAAMKIKDLPKEERLTALRQDLSNIKFPEQFQLPLDPRLEVNGLQVDKCRYMDSKKLPLWLTFTNVQPNVPPVIILFKVGDDLRQDVLTLQMIRIMDSMWKNEGLDLRLKPYKAISTGDQIGMIEVVLDSETTNSINMKAGGATAVLNDKVVLNWIHQNNPGEKEFEKAKENFMLSCAGYCVATYVLGIGDRHSDNVMLTRAGHLFHIDFGHFLGNYKKKYGMKRERAPFVFTPQFAKVLGGSQSEMFKKFEETCAKAYSIIRDKSTLFINLFAMMLSTGIPELTNTEDIQYLSKAFALHLPQGEAEAHFISLIHQSLNTKTTQVNDFVHGLVHKH